MQKNTMPPGKCQIHPSSACFSLQKNLPGQATSAAASLAILALACYRPARPELFTHIPTRQEPIMTTPTTRLSDAPDLILHNARIYTVDPTIPWAEAIAIRKHRITAIGSNADVLALAGPTTQRRDLGGRLVLPGLCDAHIHFLGYSFHLRQLALDATTSKAEALQRIAEHAAT